MVYMFWELGQGILSFLLPRSPLVIDFTAESISSWPGVARHPLSQVESFHLAVVV